jgi:RecA-family ATPase
MTSDLNDILRREGPGSIRAHLDHAVMNGRRHMNGTAVPDGDTQARIKNAAAEIDLQLICAGQLLRKEAPKREWFCYPWLPRWEPTLFAGDGGIGKSTLTNQAAIASALGIQWLGHDIFKGRSLILTAEDGRDELHYRLEQIVTADSPYSLEDALECLMSIFIVDATKDIDPTLAIYDEKKGIEPTPLYHAIKREIEKRRIDLLIVDSLADTFSKEIERHAARSFIRLLRDLNCTTILIAHPSVDAMKTNRGYAGSTHWNASVRSRLYFKRAETSDGEAPDPDLRVLELPKTNRARAGTQIFLRWKDGRFIPEKTDHHSIDELGKQLKAEEVFIELLGRLNEQRQTASPNKNQTFAPLVFSKHPDSQGVSKAAFERAMQVLLSAGRIKIVDEGPQSRRYKKLVVVQ